jgi:hypothetical protein
MILYNTDFNTNKQCNSTLCSNGVPFASSVITCSNLQQSGWTQLTNVNDFASTCNDPICPPRSNSRPYYYGPDSGGISSAGGNCPVIYCKVPKAVLNRPTDTWTAMTVGVQGPQCAFWDINPAGVRVMNARAKITRWEYSVESDSTPTPVSIEYLDLSSRQGGAYIQSSSVPLVGQMLPVQSSQGSVPPAENGGIVTCSSDISLMNIVNDMPPQDTASAHPLPSDIVYNPWLYTKSKAVKAATGDAVAAGCVLPAAACREFFPAGHTPNSFWYKVDSRDVYQYGGNECNSQGMQPFDFVNPVTSSRICAATARSTQGCTKAVSGQCVPNYLQFNEINNPLTYTPCLVDQDYERFLRVSTTTPFDQRGQWPGISFVPSTYNPLSPQWWMNGGILMSSSLGDNTVSSDIIMIVGAKYLGEVTSISSGQFVNESMLCNAVQGGAAASAVLVHNTGNLPGLYFVTFSVDVGPKGNQSAVEYETPVTEITDGVNVYTVIGTSVGVEAGQYAQVQFNYKYSGPASNDLRSTLELWILASENTDNINGYQRVDSITVSCTITIGRVLASRNLTLANITSNANDAYTCEWWDLRYWICWGHYRQWWMYIVNLFEYWSLFIMLIAIGILTPFAIWKISKKREQEQDYIERNARAVVKAFDVDGDE